ncbi:MAG: tRNA (cytidine(34)-2'-O)-methyltransferase [Gammaproteobacteria bacterium]|nr:tRNA (cytidine(34)-2'-O)-methyltransferase [Gammaproteobacteria bacterium]
MFRVLLFEPEIPPNTGNIIRLCANTGSELHLIEPLGFSLDAPKLRRAGLDYHEWASVKVHPSLDSCLDVLGAPRVFAFSTHGREALTNPDYAPGDALLFGPETRGLPSDLLNALPATRRIRIPMMKDNRSLNLSNAVAVAVYEAWRQNRFAGSEV